MLQETLLTFVEKEHYDFDLDFIISRLQYISGMKRFQAERLILNDT